MTFPLIKSVICSCILNDKNATILAILQFSLEKRLWACFAREKFFLHFMTTRRFLFSISLMVKHVSVSRGVRTAMSTHWFNDSRRPLPAGYVPLSLVLPSQNIAHSIVTHALAIPRSYILFTLQCMACGWGKSSSSYRTGYVCSWGSLPMPTRPVSVSQAFRTDQNQYTKQQSAAREYRYVDGWPWPEFGSCHFFFVAILPASL